MTTQKSEMKCKTKSKCGSKFPSLSGPQDLGVPVTVNPATTELSQQGSSHLSESAQIQKMVPVCFDQGTRSPLSCSPFASLSVSDMGKCEI